MKNGHRELLAAAVEIDHPCQDTVGCDIAVALQNGYVEAAAYLLTGATETPTIDALTACGMVIPGGDSPEFDRWAWWYRRNGHQCEDCETYMFSDSFPVRCTNCLATVK